MNTTTLIEEKENEIENKFKELKDLKYKYWKEEVVKYQELLKDHNTILLYDDSYIITHIVLSYIDMKLSFNNMESTILQLDTINLQHFKKRIDIFDKRTE